MIQITRTTRGRTRTKRAGGTPSASMAKRRCRNSYKHVPHCEKPPHLVAKRNARERRRVQAVNSAFSKLRDVLPLDNRGKRVSKVKTLKKAMDYIQHLSDILGNYDNRPSPVRTKKQEIQSEDPPSFPPSDEENSTPPPDVGYSQSVIPVTMTTADHFIATAPEAIHQHHQFHLRTINIREYYANYVV
ncbi:unnamed protein product [Cyprideis torosa]|uniref:Uncharacterized protein n=1 Tax=Cyprideis torosa TaxID=163714 RepID=A0A7R8ZPV8_9CRUS|nr:unnamed protein product [Cyprideis torosa]CAG0889180.1 unnamed protein product [Cyprideis torosa]